MSKTLLTRALLALTFVCAVGASASANIILDLDVKEGNQGIITKQVQPGDIVEVELIAQQGAQDIQGFEVVVQFDSQKFQFNGYRQGGLMAAAVPLPASDAPGGIKISAGFLGGKSAHDSGSLGMLMFQVTRGLGEGGVIMLTQGSFGSQQKGVEAFALTSQVTLQGQPGQQTSSFANQGQGQGQQGQGQQGQGQQGQGQQGQGQGQGQQGSGFHNPNGQQGSGFHNPHGQQGQGQGQHGQGQQGQHGQGQQGQHGQGQQGQHGQGQHGQQGSGFQNQDPMGNTGNNPGMNPQDPMQMIKHLPPQLQQSYIQTHKVHLQSKLTELNSIQQTLGHTQRYLAIANEQEKRIIGRVLRGFYHEMHHPDPNQPPTPPPSNVNDLLFAMFQNVNQEIQHITQELQSIR